MWEIHHYSSWYIIMYHHASSSWFIIIIHQHHSSSSFIIINHHSSSFIVHHHSSSFIIHLGWVLSDCVFRLMRYVGLRRRPALAGANGMQTRQARVLWNVRALGNALGVRGGLQGRVLYVKIIKLWFFKIFLFHNYVFTHF